GRGTGARLEVPGQRQGRGGDPRRLHLRDFVPRLRQGQGPGRPEGQTRRQGEGVTMSDKARSTDAGQAWAPYVPDEKAPWNLRRVVHLHRRAGFAATWEEIQRDLKDCPRASIDRVLAGKASTAGVPEDFAQTALFLAEAARDMERLKAWWFYRMLFGPDPL